jgi:hypothetical protein
MQTIQVALDSKLPKAAYTAARRRKVNRSALIRQTLQEHLSRSRLMEFERDRNGCQSQPQRRRVSSVGGDRSLAGRLSRGDVHLCRFSAPGQSNERMQQVCSALRFSPGGV